MWKERFANLDRPLLIDRLKSSGGPYHRLLSVAFGCLASALTRLFSRAGMMRSFPAAGSNSLRNRLSLSRRLGHLARMRAGFVAGRACPDSFAAFFGVAAGFCRGHSRRLRLAVRLDQRIFPFRLRLSPALRIGVMLRIRLLLLRFGLLVMEMRQ